MVGSMSLLYMMMTVCGFVHIHDFAMDGIA